jgi:hypothetical protein
LPGSGWQQINVDVYGQPLAPGSLGQNTAACQTWLTSVDTIGRGSEVQAFRNQTSGAVVRIHRIPQRNRELAGMLEGVSGTSCLVFKLAADTGSSVVYTLSPANRRAVSERIYTVRTEDGERAEFAVSVVPGSSEAYMLVATSPDSVSALLNSGRQALQKLAK